MRNAATLLAVVLLTAAVAIANPTWEVGYPKSGNKMGSIVVKGSFTHPAGLTPTGDAVLEVWPAAGGAALTKSFKFNVGGAGKSDWGECEIDSLTSGGRYNVWVKLDVKDAAGKITIYSPGLQESSAK